MGDEERYVKVFSDEEMEKLVKSTEKVIPDIQPIKPLKVKVNNQEFEILPQEIKIVYRGLIGVNNGYENGLELIVEFGKDGHYTRSAIIEKVIKNAH